MNPRHASLAAAFAALSGVAIVATAAGCNQPHRRNDWRTPAPPMTCTTDADCRGGTCTMDGGAAQGTCTPPPRLPGDGGAAPRQPGVPNVQPSPSDIQI